MLKTHILLDQFYQQAELGELIMNLNPQRRLIIGCFLAAICSIMFLGNTILVPRGFANAQPTIHMAQQLAPTPPATPAQWQPVEQAMGKPGTLYPGNVFKFGFPRRDLQISARGVSVKPTFALGSWIAFRSMGTEAMAMGDLVLTAEEITPVMQKLQQGGIEQTALHNHIPDPTPTILYLHISGQGNPVRMAKAIHAAIAQTKTPLTAPTSQPTASDLEINTKQIDEILGATGKVNGGVYQVSIPRAETITENGMEIPPAMGTATVINFQPTGGGKAAITGDFVLLGQEVNSVIRTLQQNGIEVTALHSHMLNEEPRTMYMHFWANDDAVKLSQGLRLALNQTNRKKA
jgi:Domain of Unknown Function (DUF1259)